MRLLVDEGQRFCDRRFPERAEPSRGSDRLAFEPSSNDVHEQAVNETRNDELRAASRVDRLVAEKLEQ